MTAGALFAYFGTLWLGLEEGYWAVITCLVVMQSTLGGTLDAGLSRVTGTAAGALLGGAGAWVQVRLLVPLAGMLCALVLPLSLLAAVSAKFRMAPVTAALVLLAIPAGGGSFDIALHRTADIVLGAGVGTATALFVFPNHGASNMRMHAAAALTTLSVR